MRWCYFSVVSCGREQFLLWTHQNRDVELVGCRDLAKSIVLILMPGVYAFDQRWVEVSPAESQL